jgi:hypothetical protein
VYFTLIDTNRDDSAARPVAHAARPPHAWPSYRHKKGDHMKQLPGYYVSESRGDKYHGTRFAQAKARAVLLSAEYGRAVDIFMLDHEGNYTLALTVCCQLRVAA